MWEQIPKHVTHIAGIDEAGRGPLAGPVTVGMVSVPKDFAQELLEGVRDSKQMPQHKREEWYAQACMWHDEGKARMAVSHVGHKLVDRLGLTKAVDRGIRRVLRDIDHTTTLILLDGLLRAPRRFRYQHTITKGDEKIPLISLASNCAKVTRDAKMRRYATEFELYGFEQHKGYATKKHRDQIRKHGLCAIHRRRFCSELT
ncbi:MAG: ribonuclease HII [Candidatus Paceibacterota bacterium]